MNPPLSILDISLRLLAAMVAGILIGIERETHGRPAGLRTTILTCVASAAAMVLSEVLFTDSVQAAGGINWRPDPARLGAGILTGIGFLGAGTIIRHENLVRGVTTAASLWFVAVLGLVFGAGRFDLGAIGIGLALITLLIVPSFERYIRNDWYARLTLTLQIDALTEQQLEERVRAAGLQVQKMELHYDLTTAQKTVSLDLKLKRQGASNVCEKIIADLRLIPGIRQVKWE